MPNCSLVELVIRDGASSAVERAQTQTVWLVLIAPDAEPLVGTWRAAHDSAARYGIPAHVTVRSPFLPPEHWADPALSRLERFLPLPLTLARLEDRPGGLVIVAEPDHDLRELTDATTRAWPTLPPHKEDYRPFAYHVTVVRTPDTRIRSDAAKAIAPHLPLQVTGTELWAACESPENGLRHAVVATMPPDMPASTGRPSLFADP